jgi:hypothetical protein
MTEFTRPERTLLLGPRGVYSDSVGSNRGHATPDPGEMKRLFDLGFLLYQLLHPCLHGWLIHTVLDRVYDPFNASLHIFKFSAAHFCLCPPFMVLSPTRFRSVGASYEYESHCCLMVSPM